MAQALAGLWTYRSFRNVAEPVDLSELLFGQGELWLTEDPQSERLRGQLAFRSSPPKQDDARLSIEGSVDRGDPLSFRCRGKGVAGTKAAGWIYDYVGYLVPTWPDGSGQRRALVGSVIRTVPHNGAPAAVVVSFIAVARDPRTERGHSAPRTCADDACFAATSPAPHGLAQHTEPVVIDIRHPAIRDP